MSESREQLLAWKAEGMCWVENTDTGETFWWPFCVVDDCTNRACLRLSSSRCYPHTLPGVPIAKSIAEETTV